MRTKFAENFTAILKIRDISQSQFARLYGVRQNTVSQWANGKREPTYHDLLCICTLLNIDIKDILGYTPRTRTEILRDIIGGSDSFQKEQADLIEHLQQEGKSHTEIKTACENLYISKYEEYKNIFAFDD